MVGAGRIRNFVCWESWGASQIALPLYPCYPILRSIKISFLSFFGFIEPYQIHGLKADIASLNVSTTVNNNPKIQLLWLETIFEHGFIGRLVVPSKSRSPPKK